MALRFGLPVLALLGLLLAFLLWLGREEVVLPPPPSAQALAGASDQDLERLVVEVLVHRLGGRSDGWRRLDEDSRALWAVCALESRLAALGAEAVLARQAEDAAFPTLDEIAAGYRAMGQEGAAQAVLRLPQDRGRSLLQTLRDPGMARARLAYLRAHLDALGGR